jgi:hypothetical protein
MNSRKTVIIGLLVVIICAVVTLAAILIMQMQSGTKNQVNTISRPVSSTSNIIDLNSSSASLFEYAVIKTDDTIELKNSKAESFIIQLSKQNWSNLSTNPNGTLIAVMGESKPSIFDIYIYNIERKNWSMATDYSNFDSGVSDFYWTNNNTIVFTQGVSPNKWVHSFNYNSKEILKIINVSGNLGSFSQKDGIFAVEEQNTATTFYNLSGEKISELTSIKDLDTNLNINLTNPTFFKDSKIILAKESDFYYKLNIDPNVGNKIAAKTIVDTDYLPLCALTDSSFLFYKTTENMLSIYSYSLDLDELEPLYSTTITSNFNYTVDLKNSFCKKSNANLKLTFENGSTQWYKTVDQSLSIDKIFNNAKFADVIK